jgi:menaquinol-cytochrome c reductase iron-sulfur subunit
LTVEPNRDQQPSSGPSLWPIGFALGVACVLVGLIVGWPVVAVGGAIAIIAGALWVRDASSSNTVPIEVEPETRAARDAARVRANAAAPEEVPVADESDRYPRSVFLEGATLGIGALIGGVITVPVLGFMVAPAFVKQHPKSVDLGPIDAFPENQYTIATFLRSPTQGEVSRRTAFVRNNGVVDGKPSFTIISNRCAHLGCPVQPSGPIFEARKKVEKTALGQQVTIIPTQPAGFGCPCHGGQYDTEGNRTAGPPVRALDRYDFNIVNGRLVLLGGYSVAFVDGEGAAAQIHRYKLSDPGQHVDGLESLLYPVQPPR